jgi:uncharacterized membrane protein (DUF106 family)
MYEKYINISELNTEIETAREKRNTRLLQELEQDKKEALKINDKQYEIDMMENRIVVSEIPKMLLYTIELCNMRMCNMNKFHNCLTGFLEWKEGTPDYIKKSELIGNQLFRF